jgi:hypothetical protein
VRRTRLIPVIAGLQRIQPDGSLLPLPPAESSRMLEAIGLAEWLPFPYLEAHQVAAIRRWAAQGIFPIYHITARTFRARPGASAYLRDATRDRLAALARRGRAERDDLADLRFAWMHTPQSAIAARLQSLIDRLSVAEAVALTDQERIDLEAAL